MLTILLALLRDLLRPRHDLLLENLALRQQILVLQRTNPKPPFRNRDRAFWVMLRHLWDGWRRPLRLVQPETVIKWHRNSWRMWWRWKSKPLQQPGRPRIPWEAILLIRRLSSENPLWGAPRIHGELMKLGYFLHESTVARYMLKRRGRPTQNWKTFLRNHLHETAAIDFLTVPTVTFRTLYVFVVLSLDRRHVVHFNVTTHPTAEWTALQLRQAFMFDTAPRFMLRDHDKIYGDAVVAAIEELGIEQVVTAARCPWQNGYCERVVGTLKRECLNHMIVFNEAHARRVLRGYSSTTMDRARTWGLARMRRMGGPSSRPSWGRCSGGRWWAGFIVGTTGLRHRRSASDAAALEWADVCLLGTTGRNSGEDHRAIFSIIHVSVTLAGSNPGHWQINLAVNAPSS